jgi:hypothetical protein
VELKVDCLAMVAFSAVVSAAAAAAGGTLEAALKHAPAALMRFNVSCDVSHHII